MKRQSKSETLQVRVTPEDKAAIMKAAAKSGMNPSEYLRACTLTMMLTEFDKHALKALAFGVGEAIEEFRDSLRAKKRVTA